MMSCLISVFKISPLDVNISIYNLECSSQTQQTRLWYDVTFFIYFLVTILLNVFDINFLFRDIWNKEMVSAAVFFWILSIVYCKMEAQMLHKPAVLLSSGDRSLEMHLLCGPLRKSYSQLLGSDWEEPTRVGALCNVLHLQTKAEPSYNICSNLHYMRDKV